MIEQYISLGDGFSTNLYPRLGNPGALGAAELLKAHLTKLHRLQRFKMLAKNEADITAIYRQQLHDLTHDRSETIVTVTAGKDDLWRIGTRSPQFGHIVSEVNEMARQYVRLARVLTKIYPHSFIILSDVPHFEHSNAIMDRVTAYFNQALYDYANQDNVSVVGLAGIMNEAGTRHHEHQDELSPAGAAELAAAWHTTLLRENIISE